MLRDTSDCFNTTFTDGFNKILVATSVIACYSIAACVTVLIIFFWKRIYHQLTHRLVISLLLCAVFNSTTYVLRISNLSEDFVKSKAFPSFCSFSGFINFYSDLVQLLSQSILTFHLGCIVLLVEFRWTRPLGHHYLGITSAFDIGSTRKAKQYGICLETCYMLIPVLVPLAIVWIPFINGNFGPAGLWCWIRRIDDSCEIVTAGIVMQYTLWYGPLMILTVINTIITAITTVTISWKAYRIYKSGVSPTDYKKTLKQVLPLLAYPIIFQVLNWFALASRLNSLAGMDRSNALVAVHAVASPSWGCFAALTSVVYLAVHRRVTVSNHTTTSRDSILFSLDDRDGLIDESDCKYIGIHK